jgi:serine/threonine protein kinase
MATATTILRVGDVLGGFRVDDVIGIGGMAIVYRAEQISLGRPVALKVLSTKLTSDELFCERFRREGKHAATLEHPNIVPIYDSGEQDGILYLAMRLVEGTNLAELIQTRGVTADQTIDILRPISSALDTAHAAGLIHRDVKPQNILITAQGHPYLADFGVAKGSNTAGLTATGGFVGSVNYASPEQIKGLTLTPASDVYALTAVLYQCLTGHVPYPRETDAGIMHAHLTEPPPTLTSLTGADSDFHTVFARGMAKDPGARYGHAGDMVNAASVSVGRMPSARRQTVPAFPDESPQQDEAGEKDKPAAKGTEIVSPLEMASFRGLQDNTAADRRREPAPEPVAEVAKPPRRWPLIAAVGAVVSAAIVAVAVLSGSGGSTQHATVKRGLMELSYSKPWHMNNASGGGGYTMHLGDPISLTAPAATLTAGALPVQAAPPGSLPNELLPSLASALKPSRTTIGGATALVYQAKTHNGTPVSFLVIPTTRGDLGVFCSASSASGLGSCVRTAETVRIIGAQPVPPEADPRLAEGLSRGLAANSTARSHLAELSSSLLSRRAAAARRMAVADSQTVRSLKGLAPEPRDEQAVVALTNALGREASAMGSLAGAAAGKARDRYLSSTAEAKMADDLIRSAQSNLRKMGFVHLRRLPALDIASYPTPPSHRSAPTHHTSRAVSAPASVPATPSVQQTPAAPQTTPAHSTPTPTHTTPAPHREGSAQETIVSEPH